MRHGTHRPSSASVAAGAARDSPYNAKVGTCRREACVSVMVAQG